MTTEPQPSTFAARLAELHAAADSYWPVWRQGSQRHRAENKAIAEAILALVEAAGLKRNVISHPDFKGEWVFIPREDFDRLRAALEALNG